ncbi:MAG: chalcone isomerase family protein [Alphaproteobacteria bacterium]|nr:chalcone isomerase family protein [Alphaproteobacteria bacterium]
MTAFTRRHGLLLLALAALSVAAQWPSGAEWLVTMDREQGRHRFRFWGLDVYEAVLRVAPGFEPSQWERHPLALSLTYARTFKGTDIARRSLDEIERQTPLDPVLRQRWQSQLTAIFPDVVAGDTLLGAYRPDLGVVFWRRSGGWQAVGQVPDVELARRFMGIWLSPQTSQTGMRSALLGWGPG